MKWIYWVTIVIVIVLFFCAYLFWDKETPVKIDPSAIIVEENIKDSDFQYINASKEMIKVSLPFPGAVTGKEFKVTGEARGMWFFEATFPVEVFDNQKNLLASGYATAEGEWMTEDFVPFSADIKVPETYMGPATLVLHRNNASGLPEHDASIAFDFVIEY